MSPRSQPLPILRGNHPSEIPLRFGLRLRLHLETVHLSVAQAAEASGVSAERMEDLLEGKNHPLAADVLRVMYGLGIYFKPEDFTERGLSL